MLLWMTILLLTAFCLGLIITPLRKTPPPMNKDVAQEDQIRRLGELEDDIRLGEIPKDQENTIRSEIERQVIDGIDGNVVIGSKAPYTDSGFSALWISLAVILIAGTTYAGLGAPELARVSTGSYSFSTNETLAETNNIDASVASIRAQALNNPENVENWIRLARTYLHVAEYSNAVEAAEHVVSKTVNDTTAELLLVDALAMQAGGRLTKRAIALVEKVLEREPFQPVALTLQGMAAMQKGEPEIAVAVWQKALANLPIDDPLRGDLESMVAANEPKEPPEIAINVRISTIKNLIAGISPETTIFVLARPVGGPKAPLAVTKLTLGNLPTTVRLDQSMAMLPNYSLADFEQVEIIARLSLSGDVVPKKGDLQGKSEPITPANISSIDVIIDTKIP